MFPSMRACLTQDKLEGRRKEVLSRLKSGRTKGYGVRCEAARNFNLMDSAPSQVYQQHDRRSGKEMDSVSAVNHSLITRVSSGRVICQCTQLLAN